MSKTNQVNKKVVCSLLIVLLATSLVLVTLMFDDSTLLVKGKSVLDVQITGPSKLGVTEPGEYVASVNGELDATGTYVWSISPDDGKTTLTSTGYTCTVTFVEATLEPYLLSVSVSKAGAIGFDVFTLYDPVTLPDYHLAVASNPYNYMIAADGLGWYYVVNGTSGAVVTSGTNQTALEISTYAYGAGTVVLNQLQHNTTATIPAGVTVIELYEDDTEYFGSAFTFNGAVYATSFNATTFYVGSTNVTGNMLTGGTTWQGTWNTTVAQIIGDAAITWGQITNANATIQQLVALYESTAWLGAWNATVTDIIGDTAIAWSQITDANVTVNALISAYMTTYYPYIPNAAVGSYSYMISTFTNATNTYYQAVNGSTNQVVNSWTSTNATLTTYNAITNCPDKGTIIVSEGVVIPLLLIDQSGITVKSNSKAGVTVTNMTISGSKEALVNNYISGFDCGSVKFDLTNNHISRLTIDMCDVAANTASGITITGDDSHEMHEVYWRHSYFYHDYNGGSLINVDVTNNGVGQIYFEYGTISCYASGEIDLISFATNSVTGPPISFSYMNIGSVNESTTMLNIVTIKNNTAYNSIPNGLVEFKNNYFELKTDTTLFEVDATNYAQGHVVTFTNNFIGVAAAANLYLIDMDNHETENSFIFTGNTLANTDADSTIYLYDTFEYATTNIEIGVRDSGTINIKDNIDWNLVSGGGLIASPWQASGGEYNALSFVQTHGAAAPANNTVFKVFGGSYLLSVSGGTGVNMTVYDASGDYPANGALVQTNIATCDGYLLPNGYEVSFTFAVAPTTKVVFVGG